MKIIISNNDDGLSLSENLFPDLSGNITKINLSSGTAIIANVKLNFSNILELLFSLEKEQFDLNQIIIIGAISNFASEINIRTSFSGFISLVKGRFIYVDETNRINSKFTLLNRCFTAINEEPSVSIHGEHIILNFDHSSRWSRYCHQETKRLVSDKTVSHEQFLSLLLEHVTSKKPFSFIRINHCENRLLGYDFSFSKEEADITYDIQFGESLNSIDTGYISSRIKEAVKNSTVLGIPQVNDLSSSKLRLLEYTTRIHLYKLSLLKTQSFTNVNVHYVLGENKLFKTILESATKVVAITCRDVHALESNLKIKIQKINIPAEYRFKGGENNFNSHFPDEFNRVESEIKNIVHPGVVVLVGAGVLGKIYCDTIFQCGGVAIDVGSLMDAVENIKTRGDGFQKFKFWWSLPT